jgi:4-diphosphocytidyl-2-C-methyl-D-erythritol kinase
VAALTSLRVKSHAKINLGLEVLGVRADGYHELRTLFQTVDLHDDITITLRPRSRTIEVGCDHPLVPEDESNLAYKAAAALRQFGRATGGVRIEIKKRIPVGGGLGGGSSNGAMVLLGLDRLWKLGLGPAGLHPLARRLGADVPYFLVGGTALGMARGDEVYPLHRQIRGHVVIADPGSPVSTAAVFRRIDARLTPRENSNIIFRFASRDLDGGAWSLLSNDLEPAALEESPVLKAGVGRIRGLLVREGALLAALSGSGSSYFGFFDDPAQARSAVEALRNAGVRALRARTLSVEQYRRAWSSGIAPLG